MPTFKESTTLPTFNTDKIAHLNVKIAAAFAGLNRLRPVKTTVLTKIAHLNVKISAAFAGLISMVIRN